MNPVQSATATFTWNNPTNAPFNVSQLGPIVGSATVAQGSTVQPNLKDERFDDMGVVIQHQLGNSLSIEGGFIFRELHHGWETINLALPASLYTLPVQTQVPAAWDAQGNITSTRALTLYDVPKNLITPSLNQISSPSGNNYLYRNLELTVNSAFRSTSRRLPPSTGPTPPPVSKVSPALARLPPASRPIRTSSLITARATAFGRPTSPDLISPHGESRYPR